MAIDTTEPKADSLGGRIRSALRHKGVSGNKASKDLGEAQSTVSDWINKGKRPRGEKLAQLAEYAGVSYTWLLTGEGPMVPTGELPVDRDVMGKAIEYVEAHYRGLGAADKRRVIMNLHDNMKILGVEEAIRANEAARVQAKRD